MEHIEQAGVHSGDSACSLPPYSLSPALQDELRRQTVAMAHGAQRRRADERAVRDPAEHENGGKGVVYVLEVNPRASRTVPYVSKATGRPLAKIAARCMVGQSLAAPGRHRRDRPAVLLGQGSGVPVHQVPRRRHDPRPRDEVDRRGHGRRARPSPRRSSRSQLAAGVRLPTSGNVFVSVKNAGQADGARRRARRSCGLGFTLVATRGHGGGARRGRAPGDSRSTRSPKAVRTSST